MVLHSQRHWREVCHYNGKIYSGALLEYKILTCFVWMSKTVKKLDEPDLLFLSLMYSSWICISRLTWILPVREPLRAELCGIPTSVQWLFPGAGCVTMRKAHHLSESTLAFSDAKPLHFFLWLSLYLYRNYLCIYTSQVKKKIISDWPKERFHVWCLFLGKLHFE